MSHLNDSLLQIAWQLPINWTVLAQNVSDPDLVGSFQRGFSHFVQTGQIWALLIGIIIGWILRNLTSYG
ncbi:MAG: hypothetical protein VKL59_22175 [Nostocaceae cyanobacterium]|nr:hypothetical protein [Nostocaceae cyanobacterium]